MGYISLAEEGVFPITFDIEGRKLSVKPATGFNIPGTIQGEGKLAGMPSLFLRTSGCNLRCMWTLPDGSISLCDTPHASFDTVGSFQMETEELAKLIFHNLKGINHLVISGGEPLMQARELTTLVETLKNKKADLHITVETNGTYFVESFFRTVDLISVSPKLTNSLPDNEKIRHAGIELPMDFEILKSRLKNHFALQQIINFAQKERKDLQLKFVVSNSNDISEIKSDYLARLKNTVNESIVLMPLGQTREELDKTMFFTIESALENGWRYSPRLQITYFNGVKGV